MSRKILSLIAIIALVFQYSYIFSNSSLWKPPKNQEIIENSKVIGLNLIKLSRGLPVSIFHKNHNEYTRNFDISNLLLYLQGDISFLGTLWDILLWIVKFIFTCIYWVFYVIFIEIIWKLTIVGTFEAIVAICKGDMPGPAKILGVILAIGMTFAGFANTDK